MTNRRVAVELALNVVEYHRGAQEAIRDAARLRREFASLDKEATASGKAMAVAGGSQKKAAAEAASANRAVAESATKAGTAMRTLGTESHSAATKVTSVADAAKQLDARAASARDRLREMATSMSGMAHGSDELHKASKAFDDLTASLAHHTKLRKALGVVPAPVEDQPEAKTWVARATRWAESAGSAVSESFSAGFADLKDFLPDDLKPVLIAGGVVAAAGAAPVIGSIISAGIASAVALGGVGAGIALASRDPRVKLAGQALGAELLDGLSEDASAFVAPVERAMAMVRAEFGRDSGEIKAIFTAAAAYVEPIAQGVLGMAHEALPGIKAAMENAAPFVQVISEELPHIGSALGEFFATSTSEGKNAAGTFRFVLQEVSGLIIGTGMLIHWLSEATDEVVKFGGASAAAADHFAGWIPGVGTTIRAVGDTFGLWATDIEGVGSSAGGAAGGTNVLASAASNAARSIEDLIRGSKTYAQAALAAFDSETAWRQAIAESTAARNRNNAGIEGSSQLALQNRANLSQLAQASNAYLQLLDKQGASQSTVNSVARRSHAAFMQAAQGYGLSRSAAAALAQQLAVLPPAKTTKVNVLGVNAAINQVNELKRVLLDANGRTAVMTVQMRYSAPANPYVDSAGQFRPHGGGFVPNRWGGLYQHAQDGVLRDAEIAAPVAPARYAWAEPATGGEAFIPRRGDRNRSLGILDAAAGWYGQKVVPMRTGGVVTHAAAGLVNVAPPASGSGRGTRLDYAESYSHALDTLTALNAALRQNGRALSDSTAKGRENRQAVYASIRAAEDAAKTKYDETGSVKAANAVYDQHIARLRKLLLQQKVNASTVKQLLAAYGQRPSFAAAAPVNSSANVAYARSAIGASGSIADLGDKLSLNKASVALGTAEGRENLGSILSALEAAGQAAQDRYAQTHNAKAAKALYDGYIRQIRASLSSNGYSKATIDKLINSYGKITLTSNERGGAYMAAGGTAVLREAAHFPAAARPAYGFAEASTGGELFIPRFGNQQRGRDLLAVGARWYGMPSAAGGGGSTHTINNTLNVTPLTANLDHTQLQAHQRQLDAMARTNRRK